MIRGLIISMFLWAGAVAADQKVITLASTTSTQNSGLYDQILPLFEAQTGIRVNVVAVGTGQALRLGKNGDADVLIVHHRPSEDAFVAAGFGVARRDVMVNDFVIVGPPQDPARVRQARSAAEAFAAVFSAQLPFVSRGDESGTHLKEQEIWKAAALVPSGAWYREIGAGMGAALNMATVTGAYVLTDRGTWLSFGNKGEMALLFEGDTTLDNPYGIILVNPARHPHVQIEFARILADWLTSEPGQKAIADYRIDDQRLFCPTALPEFADGRCSRHLK